MNKISFCLPKIIFSNNSSDVLIKKIGKKKCIIFTSKYWKKIITTNRKAKINKKKGKYKKEELDDVFVWRANCTKRCLIYPDFNVCGNIHFFCIPYSFLIYEWDRS